MEELALLPLEDEQAVHLLTGVPEEKRMESWWFILRDGTPIAGDNGGGLALLAEVKLTKPIANVLRALRLSPLLDVIDKLVARYREQLSHIVPKGPAPRRFP